MPKLFLMLALSMSALLLLQAEDKKPNIILVMADDQGYGDAGFPGHPFVQTPHLDAMAKESVVFDRFYAGAPVCSPTRASVMTGRTPMRTNVLNHGHYLRPHEFTIAEALRDAGYLTAHFGKWHIGSVQKASPTSPGGQGFDHWLTALNFYDIDPYMSENGSYKQLKGQGTTLTMDAAIQYIKSNANGDKPLFTVVWFPSPHDPHEEVCHDPNLYAGKKHQGYFQEITLIDSEMGKLRKALRNLNIHENTIVWYCSDNGGLVAESSGGRSRKGSIYEGGLRVPCILEWPAKFKNKHITTPASTSDIFPTLLKFSEVEMKSKIPLDGIDLQPFIDGTAKKRTNTIGFWHYYTNGQSTWSDRIIKALADAEQKGEPNPHPERLLKNVNEFPDRKPLPDGSYPGHAALLDWPYKIHAIKTGEKPLRYELYNLEKDPMEKSNLIELETEKAKLMQNAITSWQKSVMNSLEGKDYPEK